MDVTYVPKKNTSTGGDFLAQFSMLYVEITLKGVFLSKAD